MRRITIWILSTVTGLVLLFSYRTSTMGTTSADSTVASSAPNGATAGAGSGSASGSGDAGTSDNGSGDSDSDGGGATGSGSGDSGSGDSGSTSGGSDSGGSDSGASTVVTGSVAQTRWGPVQVQITVSGGRITAAQAIQYPNDNHRDQEINSYALPILNAAAVQAQSADIDTVSGATVTSDGYRESLQAAIDAANLK